MCLVAVADITLAKDLEKHSHGLSPLLAQARLPAAGFRRSLRSFSASPSSSPHSAFGLFACPTMLCRLLSFNSPCATASTLLLFVFLRPRFSQPFAACPSELFRKLFFLFLGHWLHCSHCIKSQWIASHRVASRHATAHHLAYTSRIASCHHITSQNLMSCHVKPRCITEHTIHHITTSSPITSHHVSRCHIPSPYITS